GVMATGHSLRGRVALVTGVSRRQGIGFAVASRLAAAGASLFLTHHRPHDEEQPWGADDVDTVLEAVRDRCVDERQLVRALPVDLAGPAAADETMRSAVDAVGHVDILVCNHARSGGDGPLGTLTAEMLDAHWAVNTRSSLLLVQAFAAQ